MIQYFSTNSDIGDDVFAPCVFLTGCNFTCPYCMNCLLLNKPANKIDVDQVLQYIKENKCKQINISGGEPLIRYDYIGELVDKFKKEGLKIGLSTNGSFPKRLQHFIDNKCLDYVALDIKGDINVYDEIAFIDTYDKVFESLECLKSIDFEIRTTLYPRFINEEIINKIGVRLPKWFKENNCKWVFQHFRKNKNMLSQEAYDIVPHTESKEKELVEVAKKYTNNVILRNV